VLRAGASGASVRGLPTLVSIRRDGLGRFPRLRARLEAVRPDLARIEETQRPGFSLSPPEFLDVMGAPGSASRGTLRALIFPRITEEPGRMTLRRVGPAETLARLCDGLFRAGLRSPLAEVFRFHPGAELPAPLDLQHWIAEQVPAFECRLGAGGAPEASECLSLLAIATRDAARSRAPIAVSA
jgi:hypothetical protein